MHELQAAPIGTTTDWRMPLAPEQYDRSATLTDAEREALVKVLGFRHGNSTLESYRSSTRILTRLTQPLQDVYTLWHVGSKTDYTHFLSRMYRRMAQTGKPYWAWSKEEWIETIIPRDDGQRSRGEPTAVRMTAYLLCGLLIITNLRFSSGEMAQVVFGAELVKEQFERLATIIFGKDGFGYSRGRSGEFRLFREVTLLMLVNRNPYIDVFTIENLRTARQLRPDENSYRNELTSIARALTYLKILSEDALADLFGHPETTKWGERNAPGVDPQWLAWIRAYYAQTHRLSEEHRRIVFYHLCVAGRWLKEYHPGIVTPGQWDEALAQEYVNWACDAKRGEFVSEAARLPAQKSREGLPLRASSIDGRISALRKFFKAIERRFYQVGEGPLQRPVLAWNPDEALATPEHIKRQLVSNPRNLDVAWWHKLTWAAASLSAKDLPPRNAVLQPLAYYRAVGLLWVTAARRSDEIRRLKVGCVSREWAPEMRDEDGNLLEPEEDLCYLRVPVNKI